VESPQTEPHYGEDSEQEPTYGGSGPGTATRQPGGEPNPSLDVVNEGRKHLVGTAAEVAESEDDPSTTPGSE